jgi:peptidyl-prolyl cis-trans isomerase D
MQRLLGGQDMAAALAAEKIALPAPNRIDIGRDELAKQGPIPPVMALMFSMAKNTVKRLEAPQNNGWYVVKLDDVALPTLAPNDPLVAATRQQLAGVFGDEYTEALVHAAQRAVGVSKNQPAIDAVRKQLTGRSE